MELFKPAMITVGVSHSTAVTSAVLNACAVSKTHWEPTHVSVLRLLDTPSAKQAEVVLGQAAEDTIMVPS